MLEKARAALPQATFRDGDLSALPLEPASVDLVVCALALEHVANLSSPPLWVQSEPCRYR